MTAEPLLQLPSKHPFSAVCIASFSMKTGVIIHDNWSFDERFENTKWVSDLLKLNLLNVQQQPSNNFADCPTSYIHLLEQKISYFASVFVRNSDIFSEYWCVAFFIKDSSNNMKTLFVNTISNLTSYAGKVVRKYAEENNIDGSFVELERILNIISQLLSIHPFSFGKINLTAFDINFLGAVITSHLQTQMTTIIEADNPDLAKQLFDILMYFCLDYQQKLSDKYYRNSPIPYLYVQIVWQQTTIPLNMLWEFKKPWTWVQLSEKAVIQSPPIEVQSVAYAENQQIKTSSLTDEEIKNRTAKISRIYKLNVVRNSEFGVKLINMLLAANQKYLEFCARDIFARIVQKSVLLIELCGSIIKCVEAPTREELHEIDSILGISDDSGFQKDEKSIIISLAALLNKDVYKKVYLGRKDKAMYLISNL